MANPRDRNQTLRRIAKSEEEIRRLKLRGLDETTGFTPIAAAVYDGFDSGTDPAGEQFYTKYKVSDAGVVGDVGQLGQRADQPIPPNYTHDWLRYVWYDDGFGASSGSFTVPEDGVYQVHGRTLFLIVNGVVNDCNLLLRGQTVTNVDISFAEGARVVAPGSADLLLEASGQAFLEAGTVVSMAWTLNMSGLTGLGDGTDLAWIARTDWGVPPPTATGGGGAHRESRFSITKIADTAP